MQLPRRMARFNRRVTNPLEMPFAGWAPMFAIIEHVGRRSGKAYRTPVSAFDIDVDGTPGIAVLLAYGPDCDWLKNLTAAAGGRITRKRKTFDITVPKVVSKAEAVKYVIDRRKSFARTPFEQAALLTKAD
jgi:deazaflavin-dependent oxidoreductase (nitroreductase family)